MLKEAFYYLRMARYYGAYVRKGPPLDPEEQLRSAVGRREESFLRLIEHAVFENPRTPYYHLFRRARCTFHDVRESIRLNGLEFTLETLRQAGVYLTHDEVKGGTVRRGSDEIRNDIAATARPQAAGGMEFVSSGSRSKGTVTVATNSYRRHRECYEMLARKEFKVAGRATAIAQAVLPAPGGLISAASLHYGGQAAEHWFAIGEPGLHYRAVTAALALEAQLLGCHVPIPEYLPLNDFSRPAEWIHSVKARGRQAYIRTGVSTATRICAAALDQGIDISGTLFSTTGEGITPARKAVFDSAGVTAFGRYVISEIGTIGQSCPHLQGNSVHLLSDTAAVILHKRPGVYVDQDVNAMLLTTVHPEVTRVFINADMEDAATIHAANCDCIYSRIGYHTILQDVQSFGKLTSHSMVLAGPPLLRILEERLPQRFGGSPGDYQVVEQEGAIQKELRLHVSPRIGSVNLNDVKEYFLNEVRRIYGGNLSQRVYRATEMFQVLQQEPHKTRSGKVHPIHIATFGARHAG